MADTRLYDADRSGRLRQVRDQIRNVALGYDRLSMRDRVEALDKAAGAIVAIMVPAHDAGDTSADIASLAGLGLHSPQSLTPAQIKAVCASALAQAPDRKDSADEA